MGVIFALYQSVVSAKQYLFLTTTKITELNCSAVSEQLDLELLDFANPKVPLSDIFLYLGHARAHDKTLRGPQGRLHTSFTCVQLN